MSSHQSLGLVFFFRFRRRSPHGVDESLRGRQSSSRAEPAVLAVLGALAQRLLYDLRRLSSRQMVWTCSVTVARGDSDRKKSTRTLTRTQKLEKRSQQPRVFAPVVGTCVFFFVFTDGHPTGSTNPCGADSPRRGRSRPSSPFMGSVHSRERLLYELRRLSSRQMVWTCSVFCCTR